MRKMKLPHLPSARSFDPTRAPNLLGPQARSGCRRSSRAILERNIFNPPKIVDADLDVVGRLRTGQPEFKGGMANAKAGPPNNRPVLPSVVGELSTKSLRNQFSERSRRQP